jgi:hypothetical protein
MITETNDLPSATLVFTPERKALHGIFVTALEGGIGYWSTATSYKWSDEDGEDDLTGFHADIFETEEVDEEDGEDGEAAVIPTRRIDAQVVARGLIALATSKKGPFRDLCIRILLGGQTADDALCECDADAADAIVQMGLFGELVYG